MKKNNFVSGFFLHDLVQVIIGATILAIPVGLTKEVWELSLELPFINVFGIFIVSILFVGIFTYYHYHNISVKKHWNIFLKRVFLTYLFSFITVCVLLILIDKSYIYQDFFVFIKRIVIVSFPASMSAAISDTIK